MKKMIRIALALALVLSLLVSAALAETVISDTFNILDEITIKVEQPVEEGPAEEIPVEEEPAEEVPVEEEPTEEEPTEEVPTEEIPVEEEPTEEVPTEEVPTEEVPVEEVPTEEVPVEEVPAEEAPTEEVPAEEIPVEEQPAEEQPLPERSLSIELSKPLSEVAFGDEVMLTAILEGYEGAEVEIVWERLEGDAWMPTGDTSRSIVITIDEQTAQSAWRFTANVLKEAQPAAEESAQ